MGRFYRDPIHRFLCRVYIDSNSNPNPLGPVRSCQERSLEVFGTVYLVREFLLLQRVESRDEEVLIFSKGLFWLVYFLK